MNRLLLTVVCLALLTIGYGQQVIQVENGSFEGFPRMGGNSAFPAKEVKRQQAQGTFVEHWYDCGEDQFPGETPPDLHPFDFWGVTKPPVDGESYLGLIIRDNESWESVAQLLSDPMEAGNCYRLSIYLAKSDTYTSSSKTGSKKEKFMQPATLRIWGGNGKCKTDEFLATSPPIAHLEWEKYDIEFRPTENHQFIILEAFYNTPTPIPYNGHILLDGASDIYQIACPGEDWIATATLIEEPNKKKTRKTKKKSNTNKTPPPIQVEKPAPVTIPSKPKVLVELDRKTIKQGQTINIKNLYFGANTSTIGESSHPILEEIYAFLDENQDISVELGGHTSSVRGITHAFCDKLSNDRAKAVATYLITKGLDPKQVKYKGYGKRKPIESNLNKEGRKKNQRVEIKILQVE